MGKYGVDGELLEHAIQDQIVAYLKGRGWAVRSFVGHELQTGVPDLFTCHPLYGFRWIDVKREGRYDFTQAQRKKWPEWDADGIGLWILLSATEAEYDKLFGPPNWKDYWKASWGDVRKVIDDLRDEHLQEQANELRRSSDIAPRGVAYRIG